MKKLEISEMSDFFVIEYEDQILVKGGYTWEQMEQMLDEGTWQGGQVDGIGYVASAVTIVGPNILQYQNYLWSGTDNELIYFMEALINGGITVYNGFVYIYNRMITQ